MGQAHGATHEKLPAHTGSQDAGPKQHKVSGRHGDSDGWTGSVWCPVQASWYTDT